MEESDSVGSENKNDSSPLIRLDMVKSVGVQFVLYFKLTSRKTIIKSKKHLERIEEHKLQHKILRTMLDQVGLTVIDLWQSDDGMKYHWGVAASEARLRAHADRIHYMLKLSPEYGGGMAPYYASQHHLFETKEDSIFSDLDKQRLVLKIIESPRSLGGAGVIIQTLFREKLLYKFYPLHEEEKQVPLMKEWVKKPWRTQPVNQIREYFGEKVAYYFGFMGYCIKWLLLTSVLGVAIFIIQMKVAKWSYIGSAVWSIFMPLWAMLFVEFWKRKSAARSVRWGMDKLELKEDSRPSYTGRLQLGVWWGRTWIDLSEASKRDRSFHRLSIYESPSKRIRRSIVSSWPILLGMVILSLVIAWFFIMLSSYFAANSSAKIGISVLNGFIIVTMSIIYRSIAQWLTDRENHRTETDYEDSMIIKVFTFDFINAFGTIFYQAFLRHNIKWTALDFMNATTCQGLTEAQKFDCVLGEISTLLISIFLVRICFFQVLDFVIPYLYTKISICITKSRIARLHKKTRIPGPSQLQGKMSPFAGTRDEYSGMVLQFGYVTMFAAAFPLGPAIALFSFVVETRTDAYKMLRLVQRAPAQEAKDIGIYQNIVEFIGYVAIITNAALIAFADAPSQSQLVWRLCLVILCQNLVIAIRFIITKFVPKVPESVQKVIAKRAFIRDEILRSDSTTSSLAASAKIAGSPEEDMGPDSADESFGSFSFIQKTMSTKFASIHSWGKSSKHSSVNVGDYIDYQREEIETSSSDDEDDVHGDADHYSDAGDERPLLGSVQAASSGASSRSASQRYGGGDDSV